MEMIFESIKIKTPEFEITKTAVGKETGYRIRVEELELLVISWNFQ